MSSLKAADLFDQNDLGFDVVICFLVENQRTTLM